MAKRSATQSSRTQHSRTQPPASPARPIAVPAVAAVPSGQVVVRRLSPGDSIAELTALLHRAYAKQVAMGLRPLAGRQDDATTAKRCASGECYVAELAGKLVGVILFHEVEDAQGPAWFQRKDVDYFSQFAVDPDIQGKGIGQKLLDRVEQRAKECGAVEIALSMAEPDTDLLNYYLRRGYRRVDTWQWPYTNYKSAILSKAIT